MNILDIFYALRNREDIYWDLDKRIQYEDLINRVMPKYFAAFPSRNLKQKQKSHVIVSITTIPSRIDKVWIPIECMMRQSVKPDKIVLWLGKDEFQDIVLPDNLQKLQDKGLEIRFCKDVGVHTKYYYVLKEYSDDYVITVDDDMYYSTNLIKKLMRTAYKYPGCVCARWVWKMKWSYHNKVYDSSTYDSFILKKAIMNPAHDLLALGVGGVLYPPDIFHKEDTQLEKALRLSPKNDDVWLKVLELRADIKVAKVNERFVPDVIVTDTQEMALSHQNVGQNQNTKYLQNSLDDCRVWDKLEEQRK